ncbi:hypothetical protein O181_060841 [Austropuccinia psidii MF-1]|uniref:Uncharacterized protein n=1 Tax=Austropuccinia psidii MF-1 TaxID=1389203 RepID=A0A9Q3HWZ1_9BASI|nr:hypothetical protein [Austropuccinia psidii MF-1]
MHPPLPLHKNLQTQIPTQLNPPLPLHKHQHMHTTLHKHPHTHANAPTPATAHAHATTPSTRDYTCFTSKWSIPLDIRPSHAFPLCACVTLMQRAPTRSTAHAG